jgi:hypothetical protein
MKKSTPTIGFELVGIHTEQFAILDAHYSAKKETTFGIRFELKFDDVHKIIGVFVEVVFLQGKKTFMKIVVSCHFQVEDTSWKGFIAQKQKRIIIPAGFLAHLAMITLGTTRGVLFAKTEGSEFVKFVIPTINVAQMIPDDALIDLD